MPQQPDAMTPSTDPIGPDTVRCDLCGAEKRELFAPVSDGHYYKCVECGLIYSVADAAGLSNFYDDTYYSLNAPTWYAGRVAAGNADRPQYSRRWHRKVTNRLAGFELYRQNGKFLEIGCSLGDFLNVVKQADWNALGIEISDAAAGYARDKWQLDVRTGTLESVAPQLEAESFDVIWAANLIEHVVSPNRFLADARKLLRPGGMLIASTLNLNSWGFRFSGSRWEYLHSAKEHRFVFSPKLLQRYCAENGLEVTQVVTTGFRWISKMKKRQWYSPVVRFLEQGVSKLARLTNQGHRVQFWARKPDARTVTQPIVTTETLKRVA